MNKKVFLFVCFLILSISNTYGQIVKCDTEQLLSIHENIDSLDSSQIVSFLCTFDKSCENNIEFSEWSNELLFRVIDKYTQLYFDILTSENISNQEIIFSEFASPLLEEDFQTLYNKIKKVNSPTKWKTRHLESLIQSAKREGQAIVE